MVDRVKYFMLGLLFLVVAGVIAYDRWNSPATTNVSDAGNRVEAKVKGAEPPDDTTTLTFPPKPKPKPHTNPDTKSKAELDAEKLRDRRGTNKSDKKAAAKKKQPARMHLVKSGDSLEKIALHYYNSRKGIDWIVKANGLKNRNRIYLNQKLIIPARKESVRTKKAGLKTGLKKTPAKIPSRYIVKANENLDAICRRFYGSKGHGARIARIMELNQLWSADVKAGTILILPAK